ncbi:hypothetical protein GGX14DRAFT_677760 [Mycena pura]|uniref:Uncharacterized protein n=1 Tax=Mycena pura TaxID=153505 RepID=A0AAD6Y7M3_9AGAR|nr:hypothetical protein GGX14DRAFT_677760 [Mycena pura]
MDTSKLEFFDFMPAHMRPKAVLQPNEARQMADKIRQELFASWSRLKAIVLAHEDTIQKRWKKAITCYSFPARQGTLMYLPASVQRTAVKRRQVLLEVDSKLPPEHAPEISSVIKDEASTRQEKRNDFLLPYVNLEDLSINNGTQFLGLLHARALRFPSEFAWFDSNTLGFGVAAGGVERYHGFNCAMVAFGETTYGRVLEYSERLNESDKDSPDGGMMEFILGESITFGNGLAVLETQATLTALLLGVVTRILNDIDLTDLTPAAPLPAPEIPVLNTAFQWQSSARLNSLRPYGPPPVFNIDDISVLINSQYEFAVQHLADLRTDPNYFAETLQAYYEHRFETLHGKVPPQSIIQSRTVSLMLTDVYAFLAYYHIAKEIIHDFRIVQAKFPNGPPRARELTKEYEDALKKLHPVSGLLEERIKTHRQTLSSSPALRSGIIVRSTDAAFRRHEFSFASRPDDKLIPPPIGVSPLVASILSHWGVINDCKSILAYHRPAVPATELLPAGVKLRLQKWRPFIGPKANSGIGPDGDPALAARAFPISNFTYPKGPRDRAWAVKCEDVDAAFAAFWKTADRYLIKSCGKELFALGAQVVGPFIDAPTNWLSLVAPKVPVRAMPKAEALVPFGGVQQGPEMKEETSAPRAKPKKRGVAATTVEGEDNEQATETSVATAPTPVSARVYKVFSTLFKAAKDEDVALQQSSVAWKDIQIAFTQIGFELHKTRGSAWTFRDPEGHKTVIVHEPHPESTMRFWEARRFGRRLTRKFGWTLQSFIVDSVVG